MVHSDPISESSPAVKRRRLNNGSQVKAWNSEDDSGDDLFEEPQTVATVPVSRALNSVLEPSYVTQPTQARTQFTYITDAPTQDVQVERSSPPVLSPPRPPAPITRAPFSKPQSLLASTIASIAPRGTMLKKPVVTRPPNEIDSEESDPPVEHSSDEESRSFAPNIKPTQFKRGGRDISSASPGFVQESPRAAPSLFSSIVQGYKHIAADDMASAYGTASRAPRPVPRQQVRAAPVPYQLSGSPYRTLDDIEDYKTREKVRRMRSVLGEHIPISRFLDALKRKHMNYDDAMNYLIEQGDEDVVHQVGPPPFENPERTAKSILSSTKTFYPPGGSASRQETKSSSKQEIHAPTRGIADRYNSTARASQPSQVSQDARLKPSAKHVIEAPIRGISDRYTSTQRDKQSQPDTQDDEFARPRSRLVRGRRPRSSSPDPLGTVSPMHHRRKPGKRNVILVDDDEEAGEDDQQIAEISSDDARISTFDDRLLKFFNTCSRQEMMDLSAQPEEMIDLVISKRPFDRLSAISSVDREVVTAKGRRAPKTSTIGDKILTICQELLEGFEAVDQLVDKCERLSKPIQEALKSWGIAGGQGQGELELMKIDDIHDSGIGTPTSTHSDGKRTGSSKSSFLAQPSNMNTSTALKDYQLVGLNWLYLLYQARTSCILADDMGLGKTCQIISFLAQLQLDKVDGVHLVIVPASTLENWLRELNKFAPSLSVFAYHGSQATRHELQDKLFDEIEEYDVVVTTYEMAVTDNKVFRQLEPLVCVYDEAHQLRNPKSLRYHKLMRIPADFKVLLTGTPLQNNLQELVAILAFIMPDLFTEKREELDNIFKHKASTNGSHNALLAVQRTDRARSMITPFILRRKKHQVLDLPKKHSRVEYCELTDTQSEIYSDVTSEAQRIFADRASGVKKNNAKLTTNVLMQLRKAAIHPLLQRRIYNDKVIEKITTQLLKHDEFNENPRDKIIKYLTGDAAQSLNGNDFSLHRFCAEHDYLERFALRNDEWMDSGKVQTLKRLVQDFAKNGDRCLVFSQFTMVMDILEAVLQTLDVRFMRLDGTTKVDIRQTMIDEFNTNDEITVFMLSTKAGGAGINLASANKVIIFDSGFNPQDDIQAENRAHRVGQTREVEVIRLVSKDTIEEQIHALGISKIALDEKVAGDGNTVAEDKAAEKAGAEAVEQMLMDKLQAKQQDDADTNDDVKDVFKKSLQKTGLQID